MRFSAIFCGSFLSAIYQSHLLSFLTPSHWFVVASTHPPGFQPSWDHRRALWAPALQWWWRPTDPHTEGLDGFSSVSLALLSPCPIFCPSSRTTASLFYSLLSLMGRKSTIWSWPLGSLSVSYKGHFSSSHPALAQLWTATTCLWSTELSHFCLSDVFLFFLLHFIFILHIPDYFLMDLILSNYLFFVCLFVLSWS